MAYEKGRQTNGFGKGGEFEFINFSLPASDEKSLKEWVKAKGVTGEMALEELLLAGYKISLKIDRDNSCYIVTTTGDSNTPNNNKAMSSRSDVVMDALIIAYYKVSQVFQMGIWINPHKQDSRWG